MGEKRSRRREKDTMKQRVKGEVKKKKKRGRYSGVLKVPAVGWVAS